MNAKTLSFLAFLTIIVIIAAVVLTQPKTTTAPLEKTPFFPNLQTSALNEVTEINITTQDESLTLMLTDKQWGLKEKHHYPVALEKVHNLLFGIAGLTILESKTSNPALYSKIGVEAVTDEDAQSTLLTLKNAQGETIASVIIGNDRTAKIDSTRREIYVRKQDDKLSWLTLGNLPVEKTVADWLEEEIVDIDGDKVRQISITHPDGENFLISKASPENKDYQIADLPDNASIKSPYTLRSLANTLSHLNLDDSIPASDIKFAKQQTHRAVFTTFDGLEITLFTMKKDDKHYAQLSAAYNPDMVWVEPPKSDEEGDDEEEPAEEAEPEIVAVQDETDDEPEVDIKQQAETLNAKFKGWVYELAAYKVDDLEKKRNDLIEREEPAEEKPIVENIDIEGLEDLPLSMPQFNMPEFNMPEFNMPQLDSIPPKQFEEDDAEEALSTPFSFSNVKVEKPEELPTPVGTPTTTNETMIPVP